MGFFQGLGSMFSKVMGGGGAATGAGLLGGGLGAIGIGALIGGLGAQQRGGNFLKGALTGAALGGVTGGIGQRLGGKGGLFGWGSNKWGNLLPAAGIFMGSEMAGQGEANYLKKVGQQRWRDEEEARRLARLSKIAGYNVADPSRFLTPDKFFGRAARGGYQSRPQYQLGGPTSMEDDPANAVNIQPLQMDPGTMGPGGIMEEFDYMDEASLNPEIQKLYKAFLVANQTTEEEVPVEMFMQLMQQAGAQEGMMAARGGQVQMRHGGTPDDYDDDEIRYDEDLIDIFADDSAMFHGDYDVADEWKEGGIATVPRQKMFLGGGLGIAALLGGAGLLGKIFGGKGKGRRSGVKAAKKEAPIFKLPIIDDEDLRVHELLGAAKGGRVNAALGGRFRSGFGGLDFGGGGFDRSGPETWQQAKTVSPSQKGVYEGYTSWNPLDFHPKGGGTRLTPGGMDVNRAAQDYQTWRKTGGGFGGKDYGSDEETARHIYEENKLGNFAEKYPGAVKLGMTAEDIYKQQLLDEEADENYTWLAEGGIADLDLRGGGASFGPGTGTSDDIPAMLSDGEFVVTANAVQNLGEGDRMLGAQRMYRMMNQLDPQSQAPSEISGVGYA